MDYTVPIEIIPIEDDGFHILISGMINKKEARLLVDTGASRSVFDSTRIMSFPGISDDTVEEYDKRSTGLGTNTMRSQTIVLSSLDLGGLELLNYSAVIIDMVHINESYNMIDVQPIDGVIGSELLERFKAVIDYGERVLKLVD